MDAKVAIHTKLFPIRRKPFGAFWRIRLNGSESDLLADHLSAYRFKSDQLQWSFLVLSVVKSAHEFG